MIIVYDPKLDLFLRKIFSSFNLVYYNSYYAPCPMCYGPNTLRIRQTIDRKIVISYLTCVCCDRSGTVEEWIDKLESEFTTSPTPSEHLTHIFKNSFEYFPERFYEMQGIMEKLGYKDPFLPPGKCLSLIDKATFQEIKRSDSILKERPHYIAIPCYKHVGLMDDLLMSDGVRFERLSKFKVSTYSTCGFCGYLEERTMDQLFIAPSVEDYIKILGKQAREGIDADDFPLIVDLATVAMSRGDAGTVHAGRMQAKKIYYMRTIKHVSKKLWRVPDNIAGETRIIEDYNKHTIAELSLHAEKCSIRVARELSRQEELAIQRAGNPYRFYINGNNIEVHKSHIEKIGYKDNKALCKRAVEGLIHVEQAEENGSWTVRARYAKEKIHTYNNFPVEAFMNMDAFNSHIARLHEAVDKKGDKPVRLLDWFEDEAILPYLLTISLDTAEVLKKEENNVDQS
jgi:hypothetical protein